MSFENEYRELMEKPIEEIREDIFFRPDNFQHELWYGDFQMYMTVGICQPPEEHALQVRKALKVMGYDTHTVSRDGRTYILPGDGRGRRAVLSAETLCRHGNRVLGMRSGRGPLRRPGLFYLPRYDGRTIHLGVAALGGAGTQGAAL